MHYNENMYGRSFIAVLIFLLLVTGCIPSSRATEDVPSAMPPAPMTVATDVPKQNDLIFIEFFAIT
ncbi:MAG TPA: hypothetical protein VF918_23190 [Anaerolineales bacterium]